MKTNTLDILEQGADEVRRYREKWDPGLRESLRREEALRQAFFRQHRRNPALRRQVLTLLDAQSHVEALERELYFRLGLQMGLELGTQDLFPSE